MALMPLLMPILGRVVLKERLQPVVMVGAVIAVGGTFLLVSANLSSGEGSLFGDFLAIAAVLCACANSLIARRVAQDHGKPLVTTAYQMSVAILAALAAMLVFDRPDPAALEFGPPSMLVLYLGVFATAGPFLLFNYALRHVPVGMTGLFASLVGPMALPMAAFFLGEEISAQELIAMAIIVLGVALPQFGDWRGPRPLGPDLKPEA